MISSTDRIARRFGIQTSYGGLDGGEVGVPPETVLHFFRALGVDPEQQEDVEAAEDAAPAIVSPSEQCHFPDWLRDRRAWGIAAQLYELRSRRNWGIGDFADLAALCRVAGPTGADFIGLNPLHALFLAEPERCSPFSPSNRRFLNPLYIAVDHVAGFDSAMVDDGELARLREEALVDYAGVTRVKLRVLRQIWQARREPDASELASFRAAGGVQLERHATFEALSLRLAGEGLGSGWTNWPVDLHRPGQAALAALGESCADEIAFHVWLQWLARRQLDTAAEEARAAGMRIGLYLDFAVGEAPDGSATWSEPELVVSGVSIGAPPDVFTANGQDWGLAPLSPRTLSRDGFAPYRDLMQSAMQGAGALRIDHAMSLRHLFWIPVGRTAAEGGFVSYPMQDLIDVVAETSRRNGTLVVGEDLGHVPDGFRQEMEAAGIFSYRILYFERDGSRFLPPRAWPLLALACLSTHDLPTLRGWWAGSDIALRLEHGLIEAESAERQRRERRTERASLLRALETAGVLGRRLSRAHGADSDGMLEAVAVAAHRFIARTPSRLACLRLADAVGEDEPTNLPGISDGYPNWRRKLAPLVEDLAGLPLFRALTHALSRERPR